MTFRKLLAAAAAVLVLLGTAHSQTVTVSLNADIRSVNPGVNRDDNTDTVVLHIVEGLVALREDGSVGPLLAERIDVSKDGLTYTFPLRKGVKFHNGATLTAQDVIWSWQRYMDPKTDWRCVAEFDGRNGLKVEAVTAPNAQTVVMRLNKPTALFLDALARTDCAMAGVVHKDSLNPDGSFRTPIGTGPFKLQEWKRGEYVHLARFADYASPPGKTIDGYTGSKRPLVEAVRFMVVPDAAATAAALATGALDIAQMSDKEFPELLRMPGVTVKPVGTATKNVILFQTRDPLMGREKIRQAVAHAINMKELVPALTNGLAKPNASAIHMGSPYYSQVQRQGYRYDPALARRLLQEAGYRGEPVKLVTNKRAGRPSFDIAVIAQQMLQAVGMNVQVEVLEWATQLDRYNKGNYQFMVFSYSARLDPALSYEQFAGVKDKQPRKVWEDPQALALIERASAVSDTKERGRIFDELHQRFLQQVPMVMLYNNADVDATSARIRDYVPWVASKPRLWEVKVSK